MIQGVRQVGEIVRSSISGTSEIVDLLTDKIPDANEKCGAPLLCKINVDTKRMVIEIDYFQIDDKKAAEYRWVGTGASASFQDRFTVNNGNLKNLITYTVPYLLGMHEKQKPNISKDIKKKLEKIFPDFYFNTKSEDFKYKYVLNLSKFGWTSKEWNEIIYVGDKKKIPERVAKSLKKKKEISKCAALYTLAIDGEVLAKREDYSDYLYETIVEEYFKKGNEQICHLCGKKARVNADFAKIKRINLFINQKINFASGVNDKNFTKNYVVCRECYLDLLLGENEISKKFSTRILGEGVFLIPEFLETSSLTRDDLDDISESIKTSARGILNISTLTSIPTILANLRAVTKYNQITILFVGKSSASVKAKEIVPELRPSRIADIIESINISSDWGESSCGSSGKYPWLSGLNDLNYLLPVKRNKKDNTLETKVSLAYFKSILLGETIRSSVIISNFMKLIRAIYYRNPSYIRTENTSSSSYDSDGALRQYMISTIVFLKFLRRLDILEEKKSMGKNSTSSEEYPCKGIIEDMDFDEPRKALFLMGVLIARIGSRQWSASSSGKKSILNKLNYQGMKLSRVKKLSTEVFEQLKQYKIINADNESIFAISKRILDSSKEWPLSSQENVYYILSGYACETNMILNRSKTKKKSSQTEVNE